MAKESISGSLRDQGKAIMIMIGIAIVAVLGMVILQQFETSVAPVITSACAGQNLTVAACTLNTTVRVAIAAFIAGFAIVGTFAVVTMLIIVVKAIIGVVKGLQR